MKPCQVKWGAPRGTLGSTPHLNKTREGIFTLNHMPRIGEGLLHTEGNSPKCQLPTSVCLGDLEAAKLPSTCCRPPAIMVLPDDAIGPPG